MASESSRTSNTITQGYAEQLGVVQFVSELTQISLRIEATA
jgi:hypothetical protein